MSIENKISKMIDSLPTLEEVEEYSNKNPNKIKKTDETEELVQYCYIECVEEDDEIVKKCRGLIYSKPTDKNPSKLIVPCFEYRDEITEDKLDTVSFDMSTGKFFNCHEGTIIRAFYYNDQWNFSTHKKINGFNSSWANNEITFGKNFMEAVNFENVSSELSQEEKFKIFSSNMDKNSIYFFILCSYENRIVCKNDPTRIYHICTFDKDKNLTFDDDISVTKPEELKFENVSDIKEYVRSIDMTPYKDNNPLKPYIFNTCGIVYFGPEQSPLKILNTKYQELFNVRNNIPNIRYRYIQVRLNSQNYTDFQYLYPEYSDLFEEIEENIYKIAIQYIMPLYKSRYVTKTYPRSARIPKTEYLILTRCHSKYWKNPVSTHGLYEGKKKSLETDDFLDEINELKPHDLNNLIKKFLANSSNISALLIPSENNQENDKKPNRKRLISK